MHDLDRRRHVLPEPRCEGPKMFAGLVIVDLLVTAGCGCGLFARACIEPQRAIEGIVPVLQLEEDLVGLLLILKVRCIERLKEIEIEVTRRLRGRALVCSAEEEVTAPAGAAFAPLGFVLPNAISRNVGRSIRIFENDAPQSVKIVSIQLRVAEGLGTFLDEGVEIDILLQVEKILPI